MLFKIEQAKNLPNRQMTPHPSTTSLASLRSGCHLPPLGKANLCLSSVNRTVNICSWKYKLRKPSPVGEGGTTKE